MSTRSIIAKVVGDGWSGLYIHSSGYPTWQGPQIWQTLHQTHAGDVQAFISTCIDAHPEGYSSFPDDPYSAWDDGKDCEDMTYTDRDEEINAALMIEWVYVISSRCLTIFASQPTDETPHPLLSADGAYTYEEPHYCWALMTQVPIDGPEPDWQAIEEMRDTVTA